MPPKSLSFSKRTTWTPFSRRKRAAVRPENPPPMMMIRIPGSLESLRAFVKDSDHVWLSAVSTLTPALSQRSPQSHREPRLFFAHFSSSREEPLTDELKGLFSEGRDGRPGTLDAGERGGYIVCLGCDCDQDLETLGYGNFR